MAIRGTSATQDGRYLAQQKKLLATMTFPKCFEQRVDMRKVQREVINEWVTERITSLLGFEDDIVVSMAINLLEPKEVDEKLDPKQLQVALTGFLEKQAGQFTEELWELLLSAQSNSTGIPSVILDKKKQEMQTIAQEKDKMKKVLEDKRKEGGTGDRGRGRRPEHKEDRGRRSRSLQRRPRSPPVRRFRSPRRRSPSVRRRSRSPRRHRRSPSPRKRFSPSPRRRSRSSPRGRPRRGRSRSPSVKRRRSRRRSPSRSPGRSRERRSARRGRSPRRESRGHRSRRSPSRSSSESRHRSPSSSRSPSPPRRRRSTKSRRKDSIVSGSDSD